MGSEARILKQVLDILRGNPKVYVLRMAHAPAGTPDVIACINGKFMGIEVKEDVGGSYALTPQQKLRATQILQAGGEFWVVDKHNVQYFSDAINAMC